jgi:hypothetical protein
MYKLVKSVAASALADIPTLASDQTIALQLDENGFQELARNGAPGRNGGRR